MFRADDRAVSEQVGMVLLFGVLVVSMSVYQATIVPQENGEVEFRHGERVRADMAALSGAVDSAAAGQPRSTRIELGTRYPRRTLFVNPPPATGTLRSADAGRVTIRNASAVGDDETADYWNGTNRRFETDRLVYEPSYHARSTRPTTTVEHGVVFTEYADGEPVLGNEQTLIRGNDIDLVAVSGSLSESASGTRSLSPRGLSTATRTVSVSGSDDDPLVVELPTRLGGDAWTRALADQLDPEGNVEDVSVDENEGVVRIELNGSVTYDLRMANVSVDGGGEEPGPAYVTPVGGVNVLADGDVVDGGGKHRVVVEVRDGYNNPVGGEVVSVRSRPDGGEVYDPSGGPGDRNVTTDDEGRATFVYRPESGGGKQEFAVGVGNSSAEQVRYDVTVRDDGAAGGSGGGSLRAWTVLDTGFENGGRSLSDYGWSGSGDGETVVGFRGGSGTQAARLGEDDTPNDLTSPEVNTSGAEYLDVEFFAHDHRAEAEDANEGLVVQYLDSDGDWRNVTRVPAQPEDDVSFERRHVIDASAHPKAFHEEFALRFRQASATGSDHWYVDDVRVFAVGHRGGSSGNGADAGNGSAPTASFAVGPSTPHPGETVTFDAADSRDDGTIASYEWDFDGDGTTDATGRTVTRRFDSTGNRDVTLTVADDGGRTASTTRTVDVGGLVRTSEGRTSAFSGGEPSRVDFDLRNTAGTDLRVTQVTVDGGPRSADRLLELSRPAYQYTEILFDADGDGEWSYGDDEGMADSGEGYALGSTIDLSVAATVPAGEGRTLYLTEFVNRGDRPVDVRGSTVTVEFTVVYDTDGDGSFGSAGDTTRTTTVELPL